MKIAYLIWAILLLGTFYIGNTLINLEAEVGAGTEPSFNYLDFEMAKDQEFSKKLFTSIHENGFRDQVQKTLDLDVWFIFFYVGAAVFGAILLLKELKVEKKWLFVLIIILGIITGVCDTIENKNLANLLTDWHAAAANGAVEKAANFAKIKFGIITPLVVSSLLGWFYFLGKKLFGRTS